MSNPEPQGKSILDRLPPTLVEKLRNAKGMHKARETTEVLRLILNELFVITVDLSPEVVEPEKATPQDEQIRGVLQIALERVAVAVGKSQDRELFLKRRQLAIDSQPQEHYPKVSPERK